ncbi:restriction endonuclease [Oceanivirga miroungae]|uniref:Restriction endonuclease type IV Mrr domain-containing protein n=1 Tax=Oceanivirga miroungae TaxID=1130046 RepID=A0A6I8M9J2_9FUSO|nr:restriction endonuclease [Oceanivirga miroungae]VWL84965.1 hypothetical protein OMES3154_00237 [Oceanivirga miroungae]
MEINDLFLKIDPNDWELFAEDFFSNFGYKILSRAAVGQDGGKDLIIEKDGDKILVSCKRYSKSVGLKDEINIIDRMEQHDCNVFLGFYSSNVSQGLHDRINSMNSNNRQINYLNGSNIYDYMKKMPADVLEKYFEEPHKLSKEFGEIFSNAELLCEGCHGNILEVNMRYSSEIGFDINYDEKEIKILWGHKKCIPKLSLSLTITELMYTEERQKFDEYIKSLLDDGFKVDYSKLYKIKREFEKIQIPPYWGTYI